MSLQTPSDRFVGVIRRFLALETFTSPRLIRIVWGVTVIYYGLSMILGFIGGLRGMIQSRRLGATWQALFETFIGTLLQSVVSPILSVLLIGIVLKACDLVMQNNSPHVRSDHS